MSNDIEAKLAEALRHQGEMGAISAGKSVDHWPDYLQAPGRLALAEYEAQKKATDRRGAHSPEGRRVQSAEAKSTAFPEFAGEQAPPIQARASDEGDKIEVGLFNDAGEIEKIKPLTIEQARALIRECEASIAEIAMRNTPADGRAEAPEFQRIIVLSDGDTWEGFDPERVRVIDITLDAHTRLCEGAEPSELSEDDTIADRSLAELAREHPSDLQQAIERDVPEGMHP